ncbi:MAG: DUF4340 domain-containing protein [Deltaproteobacteria bacterium]|nr:DUF4340 domain-containing protein [Deltaproteobacteria bacterium]MBN2670046.1 DUF4340 domain-containing protein [Deltaproteobacteria bacterium]
MKNKTVIAVLAVAALLFLYIALVDDKLQTTDEKQARAENVFHTLRADRISRIELTTPKGRVTLQAIEAGPGEEHAWQLTAPVKLRADDTEVLALVSAMDFLIFEREVKEDQNDSRFGLQSPRIKGKIQFGNETVTFAVGSNAADTEGVYISTSADEDRFFVVSRDFWDAVNKGMNDLRDKHLISDMLTDTSVVSLNSPSATMTATRETTGEWKLKWQGTSVLAAASQMQQLVEQTEKLEVTKFVSDNVTGLKQYGLDKPRASVRLGIVSGKSVKVSVGRNCDKNKETVYATVAGTNAVHCVSSHFLNMLNRPVERYVEKRLLPYREDELSKIELRQGAEKLLLEKNDESLWNVSGLTEEDTSLTAVSTLLDELSKISASTVEITDAPPLAEEPNATVFFETTDQRSLTIHLYTVPDAPATVRMQRDNSKAVFTFSANVLTELTPYPLRFRKKVWENTHKEDVLTVDITSSNGTQSLQKVDGEWMISKPESVKTDAALVKKLLTLVSETPVVDYIRTDTHPFAPGHLFARVSAKAALHLEAPERDHAHEDVTQTQTITIEIGERADGASRFARIVEKPEGIFTVDDDFTSFLNAPLAARNLLAVNASMITEVSVQSDSLSFTATKTKGQWHSDNCTLQSDALERIVIDFGSAKAVSADGFGTPIGAPVTTVSFSSPQSDVPAVLRFADEVPDMDGVKANRDGVNVTFVMPMRLLRDLTAVCR